VNSDDKFSTVLASRRDNEDFFLLEKSQRFSRRRRRAADGVADDGTHRFAARRIDMLRKLVRRGTAVLTLTFALTLALAGAAPAAASQGAHFWTSPWSWLVRLWQAATGVPAPNPDDTQQPGGRGAGLDPDGQQ
jgi:hypothetical protein